MSAAFYRAWVVIAIISASRIAFAQPRRELRPSSLGWVRRPGAESCKGPNAVGIAVETRLGRAVFVPTPRAELAVEALVEPLATSRWHVAIALSSADGVLLGQRDLESTDSSCNAVTEAAVLAIALMIDPEATFMRAPEPPARTEAPVALPTPTAPTTVPQGWRGEAEASFNLGFGTLPKLSPGLVVRGRARPPAFPLQFEVHGRYDFRQTSQVVDVPPAGGRFSRLAGGASICSPPAERRSLAAFACLGGEAGAIIVQNYGVPDEAHRIWMLNMLARGQIAFSIFPHGSMGMTAELSIPLHPIRFSAFEGTVPVYDMATIAGAVGLSATYVF